MKLKIFSILFAVSTLAALSGCDDAKPQPVAQEVVQQEVPAATPIPVAAKSWATPTPRPTATPYVMVKPRADYKPSKYAKETERQAKTGVATGAAPAVLQSGEQYLKAGSHWALTKADVGQQNWTMEMPSLRNIPIHITDYELFGNIIAFHFRGSSKTFYTCSEWATNN